MFHSLALLTHAQRGVRLQYAEPASILIVQLVISNVLVEAIVKILTVYYNGLIVPIRKVCNLR